MKSKFLYFLLLISFLHHHDIFAYGKIQWQKYLNDTSRTTFIPNWHVQSATTDADNNLYIVAATNGTDSVVSVITKYSGSGELLWQTTVLPYTGGRRFTTCYDRHAKLYIDLDSNLVCIVQGFDTLGYTINGHYNNFILLTKWSQNGALITSKLDYLPTPFFGENIQEVEIEANGDIFVPIASSKGNMDSVDLMVKSYDKDFDSLFSYFQRIDPLGADLVSPPVIAVKDSLINLAYSTNTSSNHIYLLQLNMNTGDTIWIQRYHTSVLWVLPLELEIMNNELYLSTQHLIKFALSDGTILAEDNFQYRPSTCLFDTVRGKIYALNPYGDNRSKHILTYDSNLNLTDSILLPYWPRNMLMTGSTISVQCIEPSLTNEFRLNRIGVLKMDSTLTIFDSLFYTYPYPIQGALGLQTLLHDTKNDLIILNEVLNEIIPDTASPPIYVGPIFIQKICYNCGDNLKGKVYFETVNNCKYDTTESIVENNLIHLMPEDIYTATDNLGCFSFTKSADSSKIEYIPKFENAFLCNNSSSYIVNTTAGNIDTLDFGLQMKLPLIDAKCTMAAGLARPGFNHNTVLIVENMSTSKQYNLHVEFKLDTKFSFLSASSPPDSIIGNKLSWLIDSINAGAIEQFNIFSELSTTANIGDLFIHTAAINLLNDAVYANNFDTVQSIVIGSFDPNYKLANPNGKGIDHVIENNTRIDYYIEFQNTGTDTAFNIRVFDKLDNNLDLSTFRIIGASHKMTFKIENRILKFYFNDIKLLDSNKSYDNSIGYVSYSIVPKQCFDGTVINNTADIYFDYNAPVTTNTTFHTIGSIGGYFENSHVNDFIFFPNPVYNKELTILVNLIEGNQYEIRIADITGKPIYSIVQENVNSGNYLHKLNIADKLASGVYLITLRSLKNSITKKVVFIK